MGYWLEGARARPTALKRPRFSAQHLIQSSRARLHLAVFLCLGLAGLLAFAVFPPKRVAIQVDGGEQVVVSRDLDMATLLRMAGVQRQTGDIVVQRGTDLLEGEIRVGEAPA